MKKQIASVLVAVGGALAASAAQAGNVYWSVGVNLPAVGTVVSNAPVYHHPAPVYVPAPVVVAPPAPVYVMPAPRVVYRPAPVYAPAPVVYRPAPAIVYTSGLYGDHHHHRGRGEWRDRDRDGRHDEYGTPYREGRWVPHDKRRHRHD